MAIGHSKTCIICKWNWTTLAETAGAFAGCTAVETEVEDLTEEIEGTTTEDIMNNDVTNGEFQVQLFQSFNNDIFNHSP